MRGVRVVVPVYPRYPWGYVFGALRRLTGVGEGGLTPEKIRAAFLTARGRPPAGAV